MGKLIVWGAIAFAAYAGMQFIPAWMKHSQLEGSISNVLEHGDHTQSDDAIVAKAMKTIGSLELDVDPADLFIARERREGERTIQVQLRYVVPVAFLGARSWERELDVAHTYPVDEMAEARRERDEAQNRSQIATRRQRNAAGEAGFRSQMREECGRSTRDFQVTGVMVTKGKEQRMVDCDAVSHWRD
jgi:hypothetical protein